MAYKTYTTTTLCYSAICEAVAVLLQALVEIPCSSVEEAVELALRSASPQAIVDDDGRVLIDSRQLERKMSEAAAN